MRLWVLAGCAFVLAGCSVLRPKEPFSEAALFIRDHEYVALHYKPETMAADLETDLKAANYTCEDAPGGGRICSRVGTIIEGCADIWTVRINAPIATAVRNRRCTGVVSPP